MRNVAKRIMLISLVLVMVFSITAISASAVTSGRAGNSTQEWSFKVKTGNPLILGNSVKITQTKGTAKFTSWSGTSKGTSKCYGTFFIRAVPSDGSATVCKTMKGSSATISLKKNKTYTIYVKYDKGSTSINNTGFFKVFNGWSVAPTWKVSKLSSKVSYC